MGGGGVREENRSLHCVGIQPFALIIMIIVSFIGAFTGDTHIPRPCDELVINVSDINNLVSLHIEEVVQNAPNNVKLYETAA